MIFCFAKDEITISRITVGPFVKSNITGLYQI